MASLSVSLTSRPWWHRAGQFGGFGLAAAVLAVGVSLLFADIPNGRAFSRFSPTGFVELWPLIIMMGVAFPLVGIVVGVALPLLRYRFGEYAVALSAVTTFIACFVVTRWGSLPRPFSLGWVQILAMIAVLTGVGASVAKEARREVLDAEAGDQSGLEQRAI